MPKKLYVVSVTLEELVIADTEEEAKEIGVQACRENHISSSDLEISLASYIPCPYDGDTCVYHNGKENITVDEAIATCEHKFRSRKPLTKFFKELSAKMGETVPNTSSLEHAPSSYDVNVHVIPDPKDNK